MWISPYLRRLLVISDGGHDGAESPELGVPDVPPVLADDLPGAPLTRAPPQCVSEAALGGGHLAGWGVGRRGRRWR